MAFIGLRKSFIIEVERVRVLHHELTTSDDAATWTSLIAELGLDLVDHERKVLVRGVLTFDHESEHLLMGRS